MSSLTVTSPILVTIYVRHSAGCKYAGDDYARRCKCRKSLLWFIDGERNRISAKTRSWEDAESAKRDLEDQLNGRGAPALAKGSHNIRSAITSYIAEKKVEKVSKDTITKHTLRLERLASFMESHGVLVLGGITRQLITSFVSEWDEQYPSTNTQAKLRESYIEFMTYCQQSGWLDTLPQWPKIENLGTPTLPLNVEEFAGLMDSVYVVVKAPENAVVGNQTYEYWVKRVRGLFLLMRWSGLSIMDALTLERARLFFRDGNYRIVTQRTKTGTDVSVVIPTHVAEELLAIPNDNTRFFFWSGVGQKKSICGNWGKRFIAPCFAEAKIEGGYLKAHRLRDTFACDLLEKGVSLEDVSKLLGHKSIKTTERHYSAWVKGRQNRLDAVVMATWDEPVKKKKRKSA